MIDSHNHPLRVINVSKGGATVAGRVRCAESSHERRRGLLGRSVLCIDEGLYIFPCEWVHTFGMKFPLDIAFLSQSGIILAIHHGLKPNRVSKIVLRADGILELSGGTLRLTDTQVGDTVKFVHTAEPELVPD